MSDSEVSSEGEEQQTIEPPKQNYDFFKARLQTLTKSMEESEHSPIGFGATPEQPNSPVSHKSSSSEEFEVQAELPVREEEYILPQEQKDPVILNSKIYEQIQSTLKPTRKEEFLPQLSPLNQKSKRPTIRSFKFKSVDVNQQIMKYEQLTYVIESSYGDEEGAIVNRSYSDFEWLFNALYENFPGIIVPSIPTRSVLAKLNISTLTASIRAQRQKGLEEFLRKVQTHPQLRDCEILEKFFTLSEQDFKRLEQDYQHTQAIKNQNFISTQSARSKIGGFMLQNITTGVELIKGYFVDTSKEDLKDKLQTFEDYFNYVQKECSSQQSKVRKIKENLEGVIQKLQEESRQFSQMAGIINELERECGKQEEIGDTYDKMAGAYKDTIHRFNLDVIYILEKQLSLDIDVVFKIIQTKLDLQTLISNEAFALSSGRFTEGQKDQVQDQLNTHQRKLANLIEVFKDEFDVFSRNFNQQMETIIVACSNHSHELSSNICTLWND